MAAPRPDCTDFSDCVSERGQSRPIPGWICLLELGLNGFFINAFNYNDLFKLNKLKYLDENHM